MLRVTIPASKPKEYYDENTEEFVNIPGTKEQTLTLEHSLVSLSKWESKWCKSFFLKEDKTREEVNDYIRCMTLTPNVPEEVYSNLPDSVIQQVIDYISAPMSATVIYEDKPGKIGRETITSELIYYWMIALNIPFECQKWHLNRLIKLIKVCEIKNTPPKKMSKSALMSRNAALNAARRKQLNTKG